MESKINRLNEEDIIKKENGKNINMETGWDESLSDWAWFLSEADSQNKALHKAAYQITTHLAWYFNFTYFITGINYKPCIIMRKN